MKRVSFIAVFLAAVFVLPACNTMRGLGQDLERGGQAIEKAATK